MKKFYLALSAFVLGFLPLALHAQEEAMEATEAAASGASFVNSLSLWLAVIIGVIGSIMVLSLAGKMGGGIFSKVLKCFGIGMLLVVLGFLAVVVPPWAPASVIMRVHDIAFVLGYISMVMGAYKLQKGIGQK